MTENPGGGGVLGSGLGGSKERVHRGMSGHSRGIGAHIQPTPRLGVDGPAWEFADGLIAPAALALRVPHTTVFPEARDADPLAAS